MTLFFGPFSPPVTGQSMAFRSVIHAVGSGYLLIDITRYRSPLISNLAAIFKSIYLITRDRRISTVYMTCSRSLTGSLKDAILLRLCAGRGIKVVNHLHGADFETHYQRVPSLLKMLYKKAYEKIDTSIVLMEGMKKEFRSFPNMNLEVVNNFYPTEFDSNSVDDHSEKKEFIVTYFSNLMASKGILDFLEAAEKVYSENQAIKFQIAGGFMGDSVMSKDGIKSTVLKKIQHTKVQIEFVESLNPPDRKPFLSISSVLVLPTYYPSEAFPLVFLEAMRCGNALISTYHNYIPEIINDKMGALVEPRKPEQIAQKILFYFEHPELLRSIQSQNVSHAINNYSEKKFQERVLQILK